MFYTCNQFAGLPLCRVSSSRYFPCWSATRASPSPHISIAVLACRRDQRGISCSITSMSREMLLLRGASGSLEFTSTSVDFVSNASRPMPNHLPERKDHDTFWSELYACGSESTCRFVGAFGPKRPVEFFIKQVVFALQKRRRKECWRGGCGPSPEGVSCGGL